ncbi:hypothetical protein [Paracnuella aquatica]|uniref:hypothetical protein n=1 Tax=Paracnuella aquatica TaxID=2268757 RepID=UPI000F4D33D5|nr:hypothetical protein [Paracnuella aquatica]RPD50959.1 hypothetical protein DRJ53_05565 [Paracnuella aquatica]
MKAKILILILLFGYTAAKSQVNYETLKPFVRSFERGFSISNEWITDTCSSRIFMLKVSVKEGNIEGFAFSDSAPAVFKYELKRIEKRLDIHPLLKMFKEKNYSSMDFVFPVFFITPDFPCKQGQAPKWIGDGYTEFNGRQLEGSIYLADPITIWIPIVHK